MFSCAILNPLVFIIMWPFALSSQAGLRVFSGARYKSHSKHSVVRIHSNQIRSQVKPFAALSWQTWDRNLWTHMICHGRHVIKPFSSCTETDNESWEQNFSDLQWKLTERTTYTHTHNYTQTHNQTKTVLVDTQAQNGVLMDQRREFVSQTMTVIMRPHLFVRTTTWPSTLPSLRLLLPS